MSYEEFLVYSARVGELEDVLQMLGEGVQVDTADPLTGNTAIRKCLWLALIRNRHGMRKWAQGDREGAD